MTSWTEINTFLTCQRKHELAYIENLEKIPNVNNRARYYGTAFHAGMAEMLRLDAAPINTKIAHAIYAAQEAIDEITEPLKTYTDENGYERTDQEYYNMVMEVRDFMGYLLEYVVPRIDLGRYKVATPKMLFGWAQTEPMIEWKFDYYGLTGIIDAVLFDNVRKEFVIVDWKLRTAFLNDDAAALDGQLALYAAVLNRMGANITRTIMWQIKRSVPMPARLNQNGLPSIAAQNTTFNYWWNTLPGDLQEKLDRKEWETKLEGKLKQEFDFIHPVENIITQDSSDLLMKNINEAIKAIEYSVMRYEEGLPAPALLSGYTCQYCDFFKLCKGALKYGFDPTEAIAKDYRPRVEETVDSELEI